MAQLAPPVPLQAQATRKPSRPPPGAPIQAKLDVGPAGDHFEREADAVAATVMSTGSAPVSIPPTITPLGAQRKPAPPKKEEERKAKPKTSGGLAAQRKAAPPKKEEERKAKPKSSGGLAAQRKAAPKREEEKPKARAQRESAAGMAGGTASPSVEGAIQSMRAGPAPGLDGATRGFMENRFGRDFGDVRVHHGTQAAQAADALGAQAFTTGNDIFFNRGQYKPNSEGGRRLLAHELTHTVQQKGAKGTAARRRIQRTAPPPQAPAKAPVPANRELTFTLRNNGQNRDGTIKLGPPPEIVFPHLNLPTVGGVMKGTASGEMQPTAAAPVTVPTTSHSFTRTTPRQGSATTKWLDGVRATGFQSQIQSVLTTKLGRRSAGAPTSPPANEPFQMPNGYYVLGFQHPRADEQTTFLWGGMPELASNELVLNPRWSQNGGQSELTMDVDHMLELQLGGADTFDNMWLLESRFNQRSGALINGRLISETNEAVRDVQARYDLTGVTLPDTAAIRESWKKTFLALRQGPGMPDGTEYWTKEGIRLGRQLARLKFLTSRDLAARGFRPRSTEGTPSRVYLFPNPNGGMMRFLNVVADGELHASDQSNRLFDNIELAGGRLAPSGGERLATIEVIWMKARRTAGGPRTPRGSPMRRNGQVVRDATPMSVDVMKLPGFMDVGYISPNSVYNGRTGWDLPGASPVEFSTFGLNSEGLLVGEGTLTATKALLPRLRADVVMAPNELRIDFPIPRESFSLGPVTITALTMSLGVGESGPFLRGAADFVISSLGHGSVIADVSREGPTIAGEFNLDMDFLDPARIAVSYNFADDSFLAEGTLGVPQGRIPGVDSGQVTVRITREAIGVSGTMTLGGPLRGTIINVTYNQTDGLKIGADNIPLPLSSIPAIQSATLSVHATRAPEGGWSFAGAGQATLAVPGATGTIGISYLDGAITFTADAQIARGPATGSLSFTATNRAIDEGGRPIDGPPVDQISVWGRGSVTIRFGNLLTGTAGVELTADNRVILQGTIGLPPVFEVFARREYNKDLFTLEPPEFPIWGVSVAGVGVGIFAFVNARVFFNAYVGPGEIRNAQLGATMDLDRPEDATVTGHAEFHVPAYAGLGLDVGGGLRARAAVAYVEGRVGLTGELGIQADASAALDVSWSRAAGLALSADLSAQAQPKFSLSANASVTVGVDLLVTDVSHTFGPWSKQLGSFGPDMTLGVSMPVRWSEANGLDLSLDNIEIQRPSLDAQALMSSVFDQLAG